MGSPSSKITNPRLEKLISDKLVVAMDQPRIWHIADIQGDEAQAYADKWIARPNKLLHDDVADEESRQIATSRPYKKGCTHSLHDLKTDDRQRFHIHLPNTPAGSIRDAGILKEPASHRFLMVVTGKEPGLFEWADAKGEIAVESENDICAARGDVKDKGYRAVIPPYSVYAIELMGGIHHFHNIRGYSFHRENKPTIGEGDDLTLNTQQWHGNLPKEFEPLKPSLIYPNIDQNADIENNGVLVGASKTFYDKPGLEIFLERSEGILKAATNNMRSDLFGDEERSPYKLMMDLYVQAKDCSAQSCNFEQLVARTFGAKRTGMSPY